MSKNYFVALNAAGQPISQRSTPKTYVAASLGGGSFSAKPSANHPLRVQQVAKPLEWVATVTFSDGTVVVVEKSKASSFRKHAALVRYVGNDGTANEPRVSWSDEPESFTRAGEYGRYEVVKSATVVHTLRNWPQA